MDSAAAALHYNESAAGAAAAADAATAAAAAAAAPNAPFDLADRPSVFERRPCHQGPATR